MKKFLDVMQNVVALVVSFYTLLWGALTLLAILSWPIWLGAVIWIDYGNHARPVVNPDCKPTPTAYMPEYWDMDELPILNNDSVINSAPKEGTI